MVEVVIDVLSRAAVVAMTVLVLVQIVLRLQVPADGRHHVGRPAHRNQLADVREDAPMVVATKAPAPIKTATALVVRKPLSPFMGCLLLRVMR